MTIPQIKRQFIFIVILAFFLILFIGAPALAQAEEAVANLGNTNRFYGNQSLNTLVNGDKMMVSLPGGTKVEIVDNQMAYVVNDHTGSARVVRSGNNTVLGQISYTPFGDRSDTKVTNVTSKLGETNIARSYTGMDFEPETDTYDYHARLYDPTTARFTGVDAIRQSISPYSYTENNPINFVDPNGLGRVSLWLYSTHETLDRAHRRSMEMALDHNLVRASGLETETVINSGSSVEFVGELWLG